MAFPVRVGVKALIIQDDQLLLVRYENQKGIHYNLPGGGVRRGESVRKCLKREVFEETNCKVDVGRLLLVGEYDPKKHRKFYGKIHKLTLFFLCELKDGCQPSMPPKPDRNQTDLEWFPLDALPDSLYPMYHDLLREALRSEPGRKIFTTKK